MISLVIPRIGDNSPQWVNQFRLADFEITGHHLAFMYKFLFSNSFAGLSSNGTKKRSNEYQQTIVAICH
jgi:hypothetical protein